MTDNKKPREFWIVQNNDPKFLKQTVCDFDPHWMSKPSTCETIHVIEKSAYDKAIAALRFYSDKICCETLADKSHVTSIVDCGDRAREVLKELGEIYER